ncbi:hypothetical protein MRX96_058599 [Rhipicephalus microplus]
MANSGWELPVVVRLASRLIPPKAPLVRTRRRNPICKRPDAPLEPRDSTWAESQALRLPGSLFRLVGGFANVPQPKVSRSLRMSLGVWWQRAATAPYTLRQCKTNRKYRCSSKYNRCR